MDEYEKWEKDCKKIKKQNKKILDDFSEWLRQSDIKEKTIDEHYRNIDFYINEFLLYEDAMPAKDGASRIGMFLGYWFIKKAMWANVAAIKQNATSLKKFYQFMMEKKEIDTDEFEELKSDIKENMPEWINRMNRYDDPDIEEMDDIWDM